MKTHGTGGFGSRFTCSITRIFSLMSWQNSRGESPGTWELSLTLPSACCCRPKNDSDSEATRGVKKRVRAVIESRIVADGYREKLRRKTSPVTKNGAQAVSVWSEASGRVGL